MNLNDFKTLSIGGQAMKKLVRASDGLVLFDKSGPVSRPWFEITYDAGSSSVFQAQIYCGYFGGDAKVEWGDGSSDTYSIPAGGQLHTIRKDGLHGTRTIRFNAPCSFAAGTATSRTAEGFKAVRDFGNNLQFINIRDSYGATQPGFFQCSNLSELDLRFRTDVPSLPQSGYFNQNAALSRIIIPAALETGFRSDANWAPYQSKFVIV